MQKFFTRGRRFFAGINWRKLFADITARVAFSMITGMAIEVLASGMTVRQSLFVRLSSLPLIVLLARPYTALRDWSLKTCSVTDKQTSFRGRFKKFVVETVTYSAFYVPIYAAQLSVIGHATKEQIVKACISLVLISLSGRPFGLWLDFVRSKIFRIKLQG